MIDESPFQSEKSEGPNLPISFRTWRISRKRWLNDHCSSNLRDFLRKTLAFIFCPQLGFSYSNWPACFSQLTSLVGFFRRILPPQNQSTPQNLFARIGTGDLCQRWFLRHITSTRIDAKTAEGLELQNLWEGGLNGTWKTRLLGFLVVFTREM